MKKSELVVIFSWDNHTNSNFVRNIFFCTSLIPEIKAFHTKNPRNRKSKLFYIYHKEYETTSKLLEHNPKTVLKFIYILAFLWQQIHLNLKRKNLIISVHF